MCYNKIQFIETNESDSVGLPNCIVVGDLAVILNFLSLYSYFTIHQ